MAVIHKRCFQRICSLILLAGFVLLTACTSTQRPSAVRLSFLPGVLDANVIIEGNASLLALLENELRFQRKNNRELQQLNHLSKVARLEKRLLTERLFAESYYDAKVKSSISGAVITYRIVTGKPYTIARVSLDLPQGMDVSKDVLQIEPGTFLLAENVLGAKKSLERHLALTSCLYQVDVKYEAIIDSETHTAVLAFIVSDSPIVHFGNVSFEGLTSVDKRYLFKRLTFSKGDCFQRKEVDETRLALIQSNLLASVTAQLGEPVDGSVDVLFQVVERHHRTVSAGVGYQSDEGFGVSLGWEHRNLRKKARRLKLNTRIAENKQRLATSLTVPHFFSDRQTFTLYGDILHEETEAFESERFNVGTEISRVLKTHLRAIAGGELSFSKVVENEETDNFALFSLPMSLEYDRRNEPLNPRSGWVAAGRISPYWDAYDTNTHFIKSSLAGSAYFSFDDALFRPTLALRAASGVIDNAARENVPANARFYVGGGGSVRGYPFQTLGPLDDRKPLGGLSFTELSAEARLRWSENWGGVVFVDGGIAYEESTPQIDEELFYGVGLGLRFYTSFAPLRIDVAVPTKKRKNIDDSFQLYISIGQAF